MIFNGKFRYCNGIIINAFFYIATNKEHLTERQSVFIYLNSAFPQLHCLKFSFKLANICT